MNIRSRPILINERIYINNEAKIRYYICIMEKMIPIWKINKYDVSYYKFTESLE